MTRDSEADAKQTFPSAACFGSQCFIIAIVTLTEQVGWGVQAGPRYGDWKQDEDDLELLTHLLPPAKGWAHSTCGVRRPVECEAVPTNSW